MLIQNKHKSIEWIEEKIHTCIEWRVTNGTRGTVPSKVRFFSANKVEEWHYWAEIAPSIRALYDSRKNKPKKRHTKGLYNFHCVSDRSTRMVSLCVFCCFWNNFSSLYFEFIVVDKSRWIFFSSLLCVAFFFVHFGRFCRNYQKPVSEAKAHSMTILLNQPQ